MNSIVLFFFFTSFCLHVFAGRVRVKVYDHRAEHDPEVLFATGPWKYKGYGYGLEYQYNEDGSYQREKGYGFLRMFGRDFCKDSSNCRPPDPKFFNHVQHFEQAQPYWGHPPGDVVRESENRFSGSKIKLKNKTGHFNSY